MLTRLGVNIGLRKARLRHVEPPRAALTSAFPVSRMTFFQASLQSPHPVIPSSKWFSSAPVVANTKVDVVDDDAVYGRHKIMQRFPGAKQTTPVWVKTLRRFLKDRDALAQQRCLSLVQSLDLSDIKTAMVLRDQQLLSPVLRVLGNSRGTQHALHALRSVATDCISVEEYNEILGQCMLNGAIKELFAVLREMKEAGFPPDETSYGHLIGCYIETGDVQQAKLVMQEMEANRVIPTHRTYIQIVRCYIAAGKLDEARQFLLSTADRHSRTSPYNILARALANQTDYDTVREFLKEMEQCGHVPTHVTYSAISDGFAARGQYDKAAQVVTEMNASGFVRSTLADEAIVKGLKLGGQWDQAHDLLRLWAASGSDISRCRTLLQYAMAEGHREIAREVIATWPGRVPPWGVAKRLRASFEQFAGEGRWELINDLLAICEEVDVPPPLPMYADVLARHGRFDEAIESALGPLDSLETTHGLQKEYTDIVTQLCEAVPPRADQAYQALKRLHERRCLQRRAYNAVLPVMYKTGHYDRALEVYNLMRDHNFDPVSGAWKAAIMSAVQLGKPDETTAMLARVAINRGLLDWDTIRYLVVEFKRTLNCEGLSQLPLVTQPDRLYHIVRFAYQALLESGRRDLVPKAFDLLRKHHQFNYRNRAFVRVMQWFGKRDFPDLVRELFRSVPEPALVEEHFAAAMLIADSNTARQLINKCQMLGMVPSLPLMERLIQKLVQDNETVRIAGYCKAALKGPLRFNQETWYLAVRHLVVRGNQHRRTAFWIYNELHSRGFSSPELTRFMEQGTERPTTDVDEDARADADANTDADAEQ